jgi:predicted NBD/HSP70 family sugar kinase
MRGTAELDEKFLSDKERKNLSILEAIKKYGPISRTDISKITKLNIVTVSNYVNNFIEQGYVSEKGLDSSSGGRRPTIVVLNPKSAYVIGVDLGLLNIIILVCDLEGNIVAKVKVPRPKDNAEIVIKTLQSALEEAIRKSAVDAAKIKGICLGASGVIDKEVGTVRCTDGVTSIYVPVTTLLQQKFRLPVILEHDVTTAAYGEWSLGAGTDVEIMLFMYSGVGCGIIINGEIYHGISGIAGEVSIREQIQDVSELWVGSLSALKPWAIHLGIPDEVRTAIKNGTVSKISELVKGDLSRVSTDTVFEALKDNDKLAIDVIQKAGERLGVRVAFLINLLNPGAVIVGGGIEKAGPLFIEAVKKAVRACAFEEMARIVKIVPARLGEDSVALGAASLVIRDVFSNA